MTEQRYDFGGAAALVVLVNGEKARRDAVAGKQLRRDPGVLRGDDIDTCEDVERAQGDIPEISERRRDHI